MFTMREATSVLRSVALSAVVILLVGGNGAAGEQPRETFGDDVTVLEVEVPVRVLRAGVPVPGLSRDDFEILDRGIAQTITAFSVQDLRERQLSQAAGAAASVRRSERRNFLLVFDLNQLGPRAFLRTKPKLASWLGAPKAAVDRIAIAVHGSADGRTPRSKSVRLLTPFVDDPDQLRLALEVVARIYDRRPRKTEAALAALLSRQALPAARAELHATIRELGVPVSLHLLSTPFGETSPLGRLGDLRTTRGIEEHEPFRAVPDGRGLFGDAPFRVSSGSADSRLRWLALAMAEAVTLLADLEGQNHVVLVTEPGYPGVDGINTTERLEPMHNAVRRSGWTFHAIDTSGVGFRGDTLFYMANETGGELIENQLDIGQGLDRLALRTELTYRLTFRPSDLGEPGSYHRLGVRLTSGDGPRVEVQHRTGYYAPRPDAERVREEDWFDIASVLRDDRRMAEEYLSVESVSSERGTDVEVGIDADALLGHPRREGDTLALTVAAIGADGTLAARRDDTLDAAGPGSLLYRVTLDLVAGRYRLRAFVRNLSSGALALTTTTIEVGAKGGGGRP